MSDPSWIFQKSGLINHYNPNIHKGTQPVRVIHHMLIYMFQRTNKEFMNEILNQINDGKLHNELKFIFAEESIRIEGNKFRTPRIDVDTKEIELHETFLSYLWCCTYSLYVLYLETIDYPRCNQESGQIVYLTKQDNIDDAIKLFNYAKYLIAHYEEWDKTELPNPEQYLAEERNYPEQTNLFYTEAVKFILCHEFIHLKLHADKITPEVEDSYYLEFEKEADEKAVEEIMKGIDYSDAPVANAHRLAVEGGVVIGVLSMFYFSPKTKGIKHPNLEDRLTAVLEQLKLDEAHFAWSIACVGLKKWEEQFQLNIEFGEDYNSYKELYYMVIDQIKQLSK